MRMSFNRRKKCHESREAFIETIQTIQRLMEISDSGKVLDIQKLEVINFGIKLIGKELSCSVASRLLRYGKTPENQDFFIPTPTASYQGKENISLTGINVISDTYSCRKLVDSIRHICTAGFRQISNYTGTYYPEINLAVIENGRHHLSVAMVHDTGSALLQICSLKEAFSKVRTDGAFWYMEGIPPRPVPDYRLAVLFELARLRDELMLPASNAELHKRVFHMPEQLNPLTAFRESRFQVDWLELELAIKNLQLDRLRHHAQPDEIDRKLTELTKRTSSLAQQLNGWIDHEGKRLLDAYIACNTPEQK